MRSQVCPLTLETPYRSINDDSALPSASLIECIPTAPYWLGMGQWPKPGPKMREVTEKGRTYALNCCFSRSGLPPVAPLVAAKGVARML